MEPGFIYCNLCNAGIPDSLWERHVQSHAAQEGGRVPDAPGQKPGVAPTVLGWMVLGTVVLVIGVVITLIVTR